MEGERAAILPGLGSIPEPIVVSEQEKMKRNLCCENCWVATQRLAY